MVPAEVDEPVDTASRAQANVRGRAFARAAAVPQQAMPHDIRRGRKAVVIDCLLSTRVSASALTWVPCNAWFNSQAEWAAVRFISQGRCQVSVTPQTIVFIVFLIMRQARKSGIPDFRKISVRRSGRIGTLIRRISAARPRRPAGRFARRTPAARTRRARAARARRDPRASRRRSR